MLELKNIHLTFNKGTVNEKKALQGVDLTLKDGDFVTVIGGNGAGKSTMLNVISGVFPADEGAIVLDGQDITASGNTNDPLTSAECFRIRFSARLRI